VSYDGIPLLQDFCVLNVLVEFYCHNDFPDLTLATCSKGCRNGACVQ
jgi:hypothetical protein